MSLLTAQLTESRTFLSPWIGASTAKPNSSLPEVEVVGVQGLVGNPPAIGRSHSTSERVSIAPDCRAISRPR
jgi:hypothetical protein